MNKRIKIRFKFIYDSIGIFLFYLLTLIIANFVVYHNDAHNLPWKVNVIVVLIFILPSVFIIVEYLHFNFKGELYFDYDEEEIVHLTKEGEVVYKAKDIDRIIYCCSNAKANGKNPLMPTDEFYFYCIKMKDGKDLFATCFSADLLNFTAVKNVREEVFIPSIHYHKYLSRFSSR